MQIFTHTTLCLIALSLGLVAATPLASSTSTTTCTLTLWDMSQADIADDNKYAECTLASQADCTTFFKCCNLNGGTLLLDATSKSTQICAIFQGSNGKDQDYKDVLSCAEGKKGVCQYIT